MKKVLIINPGSTKVKRTTFPSEYCDSIGIRVVHGGELMGPVKVNAQVKKEIKKAEIFAPIHNKVALKEIARLEKKYPNKDIYAVFDTDFHKTISQENYTLSINKRIAEKYSLRRFGFHGIAVESIVKKLTQSSPKLRRSKVICVHLGGGSSVTAIKDGKSIYNSMGLTPLSGIMGKTRSGNVDPDIFSILSQKKFSIKKTSEMLSHRSGFLGLTGMTDTKRIIQQAKKGNKRCKLVYEIYLNQIAVQVAKSFLLLKACDLITLSGGIGFNNRYIKNDLYQKIKILGIKKSQVKQVKSEEEKLIFEKLKKVN